MLLCSGCGLYKPYSRPEIETDHLFGETVEADTATIADLRWDEVFTDPLLQQLIRSGLENNTDLQIAGWRVTEAEASLRSARLSYLPTISHNPQGTLSSFDGGSVAKTYQVPNTTASWEVETSGRLTNTKRQKKATLEQSEAYRQTVQTQLIASIANSYYTLLMLDRQLTIVSQTSEVWEKNIRMMRALKEAGQTTEAAVAQAEANKNTVDASAIDLRRQITEVENALCTTLGETPHSLDREMLENQSLPETLAIGIPLDLLANRPDIRSAEAALAEAYYLTNEARSYFYPSLTLSGSIGWTNNGGAGISNPGAILWQAIGSLTQSVFNKGINRARLRIAKAQQEEARLSFQQALLNAGSEVNNALAQYQAAKEKVDLYEQQVIWLESAVRSTELLMRHSDTTYLEVLTAQQTLLQAQLNQVANRFDEIQGVITLYRALGGGRI